MKKNISTKIKLNIDTPLIISVLILLFIGILSIYSANIMKPKFHNKYIKQIIFSIIGIAFFFVFLSIRYQRISQYWIIVLILSNFILLLTLVFARRIHGAKSWIFFFGQGVQPSEIVKLLTIIWYAKFLENIGKKIKNLKWFLISLTVFLPTIGLILLQPDFGTVLIYVPIMLSMMFVAGADRKHLFLIVGIGLIGLGIPLITFYSGEVLKLKSSIFLTFKKTSVTLTIALLTGAMAGISYLLFKRFKEKFLQVLMLVLACLSIGFTVSIATKSFLKKHHYLRFLAFIDNKRIDPRGAGWNISQSLTAIGAGGFNGQGFLKGSQKNGSFLPAQDTDFIFPVIAEEWGFKGSIIILILFTVLLYRGINVIFNSKDMIGSLIATGIIAMFFFHIVINIGMSAGIMPVMGVPLPFLSYGGSFLVTCIAAIGLLLNVELRRYVY